MVNNRLKTRPKTNEELLQEFNQAKNDWKEGRAIPWSELKKKFPEIIKRTREMEKQFSEKEKEGDGN